MVKGKLILICHYGGEFNKSDDGSSSYEGGEANAVNINSDTVFDDLKLKLAEMCNFDHKSVTMKYFLPGNNQSLINLGNNKDLLRMLSFHENSVTADIYIFGKEGFVNSAVKGKGGRVKGIKVAETVDQGTAGDVLSADTSDSSYSKTTSSSEASDDSSDSYVPQNTRYKRYVLETSLMSPDSTDMGDTSVRMVSTPADAVKKRRRAAASKAFVSDAATPTVTDNSKKRRSAKSAKSKSRRKKPRKTLADLADEVDALSSESDPEDFLTPSSLDNVAPGQVVASWKKAITSVGQEFRCVDEFRDALRRYAVAHQFAYKLKKSDATRVSCKCAAEGCPWRIYASKVQAGQTFRIKKMVKSHTCGGESRKSAQPTRRWLVGVVKDILQDAPQTKPKEVARRITEDFGIPVKMYLVRRAIEDVKVEVLGSQAEAYDDLPKFCKKVEELNPGTLVNLVTGDDKRFQRLFLCFHSLALGFQNGCRPLLFLDSTSLRSKYHESLLVAVALDGNDGFLPLAIAVVDVENEDSWIWFLEQLKAAIPASVVLTLVTDSEKLQKESILKVFENAHIGYSLPHLIGSFNVNMKGPFSGEGRGFLSQSLTNAAHAARLDGFQRYMEEIRQISPSSHEWLLQSGPEHWASSMFIGEQFNHITENPLEQVDKLMEEEKAFPITRKLEAMVNMMSELINERHTESSSWSMKLTPSKEGVLRSRVLRSQKQKVLFSTEFLFEVRDEYTNAVNVFNITTMDCSCGIWRVTGIPCCHAMAVLNLMGRDVYDYSSPFFTIDRYKMAYSKPITPLPEKGNDDFSEDEANEHTSDDVEGIEHSFEYMDNNIEPSSENVEGIELPSETAENVKPNEHSSDNVERYDQSSENAEGKKHISENVNDNEHPSEIVNSDKPPSQNVNDNERPSEYVNGDERPSVFVEHPSENVDRPSENAEGTERPSENAEGTERPSENAEGTERPSENAEGNEHPSETVEGSERPSETVEGTGPPSEIVEANERISEIAEGNELSSETAKGRGRPAEKRGRGRPSESLKAKPRSKEVEVLPPSSARRSEQDKAKQSKPLDPSKRTVICTRCLGAGHNKKTCKATLE